MSHKFEDIISLDNLLEAWKEFLKGKKHRKDVQEFSFCLIDNIISLHQDLFYCRYEHGGYQSFKIFDPKSRDIHKANIRDRLLHHAVYRKLYPFFNRIFIYDSFSCQINKGTHKALNRFRLFSFKVSKNNTKTCWVLKGDIKKFFANINHDILISILKEYIPDANAIWLLERIIKSFPDITSNKGLLLGNLTSQLFVNIYMNKFDQFIKHKLKIKYYIRYADDFVIFSQDKKLLKDILLKIKRFLYIHLSLQLHSNKLFIKTLNSGVDFLGWVHFPDHRVLRTSTKKRMFNRIKRVDGMLETIQSYYGLISYGNAKKLEEEIKLFLYCKNFMLK